MTGPFLELEFTDRLSDAGFESAVIGMAVIDADGRWLRANRALCETLGFSERELGATTFQALLPEASRTAHFARFLALYAGQTPPYQEEYQMHTQSGLLRWVRASLAVAIGARGHAVGIVAQIEDVDDRHGLEATASTSLGELRRSNTELEIFAFVAAHDLQEPLRKIRTFGNRLEVKFGGQLGADGVDYLHRMQSATARMQRLIDDLLAYARISLRGQPFKPVDLNVVVTEVATDLEARIEQGGGRLSIGELPKLDADATQMRQLFQNLLGNALKFASPDRPPVVTVGVTASEQGCATIVVADNGIGFEPGYAQRIFEPFERLHGQEAYEGTGIGLAICRRIVERHGGRIHAESALGAGAQFKVTLPLRHGRTPR